MSSALLGLLEDSFASHSDRPALIQGDESRTYADVWRAASRIATTIGAHAPSRTDAPFVAFVGSRSLAAYEHLLGVVLAGRGYFPLEPEQPPRRLAALLDQAGVDWIVTEAASLPLVAEILSYAERPMRVIVPDGSPSDLRSVRDGGRHEAIGRESMLDPVGDNGVDVTPVSPLYLLFTSGSTGRPKGVVIEHGNMAALLSGLAEHVELGPSDVAAQLSKLSFDPSAMVTMLAWTSGAALLIPEQDAGVLSEARLIQRHGVTLWVGVPSRTSIMRRLRQLGPGAYPGLQFVLHGGEALTVDDCQAWASAAPQARLINQYGPTETTVCVTLYTWEPDHSGNECAGVRVPIGYPLQGVELLIVDESLDPVADGQTGELLVGGPQVARGYLGDPQRTASAFVLVPGRVGRFYRTGDRVRRAVPAGPLHFAGRADDQIKIMGRRVELGEIEAAVRSALGVEQAVALGWPETAGGYDGVEVFVTGGDASESRRALLAGLLPPEAQPRHIHVLAEVPLTVNGKVDRKVLRDFLAEGSA